MSTQEVQQRLEKALGLKFDELVARAGTNEHNLKEEWSAVVAKVEEFTRKYAN